ncbi:T9SS type A sorting domain-containing protein [Lewinella cohaerens]|uniref:T9SS type A sorting domain-containing protein n=1 Tax=Lewinella cohaerens TaxID=70995 RepID=UPI0003A324B2|nr:T9SS type A sorting domain-containing protein [Lewinella cohaerens]
MNTQRLARLQLMPLCGIAIKQLLSILYLPAILLLLASNALFAQQNCNTPTDPVTSCNIMYCDGSNCDDLVPADGVSTCTSCMPCGVAAPPSDRYACAIVELDLTGTPEYAADPTLAGCELELETQENGNFDFYIQDGSINCGTPDFQIGDGAMIPIGVVTAGMVELIVCKTGGSGRRDLNILLSCCTPAATCQNLPDIDEEGCDIPTGFTDYNDVFSNVESCGATITMDFVDNGDAEVCGGFGNGGPTGPFDNDGADFVRTYTLYFDGVPFATCPQNIIIEDVTPPTITCPPNAMVECGMPIDPAATGSGTAMDACGPATVTFSDSSTPGCGGTETIIRTWTATDNCGNASSCTQTINVVDTTPPDVTCADFTATFEGCPGSLGANTPTGEWFPIGIDGGFTAASGGSFTQFIDLSNCVSDECSDLANLEYTLLDSYEENRTSCSVTLINEFSVRDECGNIADDPITTRFTIQNTSQASIVCPANVTVECGDSTDPADTGMATASDACGAVTTVFNDQFTPGCGNTGTITRTWTANADCGSPATCTQIITIVDTTPPTIVCPPNATVECGMPIDPAATGSGTAMDACGPATVTFSDSSTPGCGGTETIIRTWTATDNCGNSSSCTQTINVVDTTPPTIVCPPNATVECGMPTDPNATGVATGSDACGGVAITFADFSAPGCGNTETITRTWTATDDCGTSSTCTQTITVVDTTPPTIVCPPNVTVECGMPTDPAATGSGTAMDACGPATVTFSDSSTPGCGGTETITRTWTATDACGNPSSCTQTITVVDTTPPTVVCSPNVTIECGMPTAPNATGTATGTDICGGVAITFNDSFAAACGNTGTITRTWTATDDCGNPSTCTQTITIVDTTPPVITGPLADGATMNVECNLRDPNWTPFMVTTDDLTITDNCSARPDITVTYEDILEEEGECGVSDFLSLWRCVWTATDECGNTTTYTLFLRIVDTQGPVFTFFPANTGIECDEEVPFQQATAEDACSEVEISFIDSRINGDCANNYTIRRRWTAVDGCGNPTVQDQFITVSDTTPPVLAFTDEYVNGYTDGQEVYVDCGDYSKITKLRYAVSAFDNCSGEREVDFEYEDFGLFSCAEYGYIGHLVTRWTATDDCGNTSSVTLYWFLTDTTPPALQGIPEDACVNSLPPVPNVQAVDDCEFAVLEFSQSDPIDCAGGQYVERTWTATDVCGNTTSATQRLTLSNGDGPTINIDYPGLTGLPSGSTVQLPAECTEEGDLQVPDFVAVVNVGDGCGNTDVRADLQLLSTGDCLSTGYLARYQLIVTALDLCDNVSEYELFIEFIDSTPPTAIGPAELVLSCGEAIPEISATDGCGQVASITFVDSQPIEVSCAGNPQNFERIWTITDVCDNSSIFAQSITIIDDEGPLLRNVPEDTCNDESIPLPVTAFDECSGLEVDVVFNETTTNEPDCGQVLTRTWTATDACGNTSTATQQVFFNDDTAPVLSFDHPLLVGLEDGDELILPVDFDFGNPQDIYDFGDSAIAIDDNCASNLEAVLGMAFLDNEGDCAETGYLAEINLTWTVTDPCGNSAEISILLIYVDTYGPEIFHVPANLVLYCDDPVPAPAEVFLKDNYDQDITLIFEEEELTTDFGLRIIRRWTAIDDCGNTTVAEQYIDIYGNTLECEFDIPEEIFCNSSGNEIGVIATGGTAPYTYSWEMTDCDGFITSDPTNSTITYTVGYTTQNFSVTITDANACQRVCTTSVVCEKLEDANFPSLMGSEEEIQFNTYPNPVDRNLRVKAPVLAEQPTSISIYSLYGQVMFQKDLAYWPQEGYDIDMQALPNGTYLIKLETEGLDPMIQQVVVLH